MHRRGEEAYRSHVVAMHLLAYFVCAWLDAAFQVGRACTQQDSISIRHV